MNATRVEVTEVAADARREVINGQTYLRGRTLASLLDEFGGFEGEVTQPTTGHSFRVSLEQWRGRDPQTTWIDVSFVTDL